MRTSVQNASSHSYGDSQGYVQQREMTCLQNAACVGTPRCPPHFAHCTFVLTPATKAQMLCDGKDGGLLRGTERTIKITPSSLITLQLRTKKTSQPLQVPAFSLVVTPVVQITLIFRNHNPFVPLSISIFPCQG